MNSAIRNVAWRVYNDWTLMLNANEKNSRHVTWLSKWPLSILYALKLA